MEPKEIIESMCFVMPYEFRGRLSIEPYLIEAMELFGKYQYNQAIEDAAKSASIAAGQHLDLIYDPRPVFTYEVDKQSILKLKK